MVRIYFADEKVEKNFEKLKTNREFKDLYRLYKYGLPSGWRLLYSLGREGIEIIALILEWCSHKEYERIFKYQAR